MTNGEELLSVLSYYKLIDHQNITDKFKIVCPFHGDVNASMQIDLTTGRYYCYGCGEKGYSNDFVKKIECCNDLRSYIILNKILNNNNFNSNSLKIFKGDVKSDSELIDDAKVYFYSLNKTSWECINTSYMHNRGFTSDTLIKVDARINPNKNYGIIFPMLDNGEFRGYVCRATNKDAEKNRKYLYNKGFSRKNTLVGNYKTKGWVVIVEGYMDWLKMVQFGVKNCCAILGWKITKEQIEKLKKYTNKVICALDNTDTGKQGYEYLKKFFNVIRFQYPSDHIKDPGDLDSFDFNKGMLDTKDLIKRKFKNKK